LTCSSAPDDVVDVEIDESRIADFLARLAVAGVRYDEIAIRKPTLEDYFLKLAGARAQTRAQPQTQSGRLEEVAR
jgi:hypothetical protein